MWIKTLSKFVDNSESEFSPVKWREYTFNTDKMASFNENEGLTTVRMAYGEAFTTAIPFSKAHDVLLSEYQYDDNMIADGKALFQFQEGESLKE